MSGEFRALAVAPPVSRSSAYSTPAGFRASNRLSVYQPVRRIQVQCFRPKLAHAGTSPAVVGGLKVPGRARPLYDRRAVTSIRDLEFSFHYGTAINQCGGAVGHRGFRGKRVGPRSLMRCLSGRPTVNTNSRDQFDIPSEPRAF
jgi:hypothetical protein